MGPQTSSEQGPAAQRPEHNVAVVNPRAVQRPKRPVPSTTWSGVGGERRADGLLEFAERQVVFVMSAPVNAALA